jgi:hypothetical protein
VVAGGHYHGGSTDQKADNLSPAYGKKKAAITLKAADTTMAPDSTKNWIQGGWDEAMRNEE